MTATPRQVRGSAARDRDRAAILAAAEVLAARGEPATRAALAAEGRPAVVAAKRGPRPGKQRRGLLGATAEDRAAVAALYNAERDRKAVRAARSELLRPRIVRVVTYVGPLVRPEPDWKGAREL